MNKIELCGRLTNDPEVRYIYPDGLYIKKEQLKDLQENKAFLFKPVENTDPKPQPGFKFGNPNPNPTPEPGQRPSMKDAIAARLQSQMGQTK